MERSQFEMNFFLAAFTFILSLAIVVQTGYQLAQIGDIGIVAGAGLVAATLVLLVLLERKTDFLKLLMQGR